jgi:Uma2 family endonuclease
MTTFSEVDPNLYFPDSDGKPMADNTEQFNWIVLIKENLEIIFAAMADVFVAGDLLWYPLKIKNPPSAAPDAMVVFGRPKGRRGSYKQWEENNIPPQVVFEILSPSNSDSEMQKKWEFYNTYGVEEYYIYDPDELFVEGWIRQQGQLIEIQEMNDWVSPTLGIRFETTAQGLVIYRPDGQKFLSPQEIDEIANQQRNRADSESLRAEKMADYLRSIGIDPNNLPS